MNLWTVSSQFQTSLCCAVQTSKLISWCRYCNSGAPFASIHIYFFRLRMSEKNSNRSYCTSLRFVEYSHRSIKYLVFRLALMFNGFNINYILQSIWKITKQTTFALRRNCYYLFTTKPQCWNMYVLATLLL